MLLPVPGGQALAAGSATGNPFGHKSTRAVRSLSDTKDGPQLSAGQVFLSSVWLRGTFPSDRKLVHTLAGDASHQHNGIVGFDGLTLIRIM
jgi:hypothetical protein